MRSNLLLAAFALVASPAAAEPALVANADGSVTLSAAIDSAPPPPIERAPRPARNAARARAQAEAELDRSFKEATAQARDAARLPPPR